MKVAIDIQSAVSQPTGIGYYARGLIKEYYRADGIEFCYYKNSKKGELNTFQRLRWENISLVSKAGRGRVDILHVPGFAGPFLKGRFKKVTTVHDLIGMIYPENLARFSRLYWQRWLPLCVRSSDLIIADSNNTKKDVIRLLDFPEDRIRVVYLAADDIFRPVDKAQRHDDILKAYDIDRPYILNVGTIEPRKNVPGLIEAFNRYIQNSGNEALLLVIAGKKGWDYERSSRVAAELNIKERVIFCDYVVDKDLPLLYSHAQAFVYPSCYEGFGLPVLEAMSCGAPVICSKNSSLPEVAGDAALLVDSGSVESMASAIESILGDRQLRDRLSAASLERAKFFSWRRTAAQTIDVYKEALN